MYLFISNPKPLYIYIRFMLFNRIANSKVLMLFTCKNVVDRYIYYSIFKGYIITYKYMYLKQL